jgi:hypothetical protein
VVYDDSTATRESPRLGRGGYSSYARPTRSRSSGTAAPRGEKRYHDIRMNAWEKGLMGTGACLCGLVRFEFREAAGEFVCATAIDVGGSLVRRSLRASPSGICVSSRAKITSRVPGVRPKGHVWCNQTPPWFQIRDPLPQYTDAEFVLHRVQQWDRNGEARAAAGYEYILRCYPDAREIARTAGARLEQLRRSS